MAAQKVTLESYMDFLQELAPLHQNDTHITVEIASKSWNVSIATAQRKLNGEVAAGKLARTKGLLYSGRAGWLYTTVGGSKKPGR